MLCAYLHALITYIANKWEPNTTDIEGTNSVIKHICKSSPGISWATLSARITIKKQVNHIRAQTTTADAYSMDSFLDDMERSCPDGVALLQKAGSDRWTCNTDRYPLVAGTVFCKPFGMKDVGNSVVTAKLYLKLKQALESLSKPWEPTCNHALFLRSQLASAWLGWFRMSTEARCGQLLWTARLLRVHRPESVEPLRCADPFTPGH